MSNKLVTDTAGIVCTAGSMQLSGVRLSVRLSVRMYGCNRQRSSFDIIVTAHCDSRLLCTI